jgi:outer membrane biogenesis lipoprotein LolB
MTLVDILSQRYSGGPGDRTPSTRRRIVVLALAATFLGACGGGAARNPYEESRGGSTTQIRISVENRDFTDVRVYAVTPSGDRPLGVVGGNQTETFRLEWRQLATLYFRLDFLAGSQYTTQAVTVSPGNQVDVEIPASPTNIIVRVR